MQVFGTIRKKFVDIQFRYHKRYHNLLQSTITSTQRQLNTSRATRFISARVDKYPVVGVRQASASLASIAQQIFDIVHTLKSNYIRMLFW